MFDQSLVIYGKFETGRYLSCPKQATGPNGVTSISQVTLRRLMVRVYKSLALARRVLHEGEPLINIIV